MLSKIFIQNFILIDVLDIDLHNGLQVITGETGAGKSIILGALRLILGDRVDAKVLNNSEKKSVVEAHFIIPESLNTIFVEHDLDREDITIIRREILSNGKSRAFINDTPVTLEVLKNVAGNLIDIHSQFQTAELFTEAFQFEFLDGGSGNQTLLKNYQQDFLDVKSLQQNLTKLKKQKQTLETEADYHQFLLTELQEANLEEVDLENLENQLSMQENAEQISENLSKILQRFDAEQIGILDSLLEVKTLFSKIAQLSHHFSLLDQRFEENYLELKDILFEIQNEAEKMEINPQFLEELKTKINLINNLTNKHQVHTIDDLLKIKHQLENAQNETSELEQKIQKFENELSEKEKILNNVADQLSVKRKKSIPILVSKTEETLKKIGLGKAKLEIKLSPNPALHFYGRDNLQFLFSANSGSPLQPIDKAISGGERSRIMLAIKKIMTEYADLPTLILDEIDTGVSGKVADEMGKLMQDMAKNRQLIVITHLAQIAAKGDYNYKVVKNNHHASTKSEIIPLDKKDKLLEIAQLLSGATITDAALQQAEELMK